jgi:hypothetical protein
MLPTPASPRSSLLGAAALLAALAWSGAARAGNEAHPRTPVLWPDAACSSVVDRSETATLELTYAIPFEDTMLGPDELPDSRTHQFFALCRQRDPGELLPQWITRDDVERAAALGLVDAASVGPEQVLDEAPAWAGCFVRITADDARRPITFAAAAEPVAWTLADAPLGVHQIAGYTFEPPFNLWRARPGFVKLLADASDPAQDLPAAALPSADAIWPGRGTLELCVDAIPPIEAFVEWAPFAPQLDYQPLAQHTIAAPGTVVLELEGPAIDEPIEAVLRVRVVDGLGREFVAHHANTLAFEPALDEPGADSDSSTDASEPPSADPGCSCSQAPTGGAATLLSLLPLLCAASRRARRFS